jgi:hypothetical protein
MKRVVKEFSCSNFMYKLQLGLLLVVIYPVLEEGRNIAPLFIGVILGVFIGSVVLLLDMRGTNGKDKLQ